MELILIMFIISKTLKLIRPNTFIKESIRYSIITTGGFKHFPTIRKTKGLQSTCAGREG
jgi:hypothetical protein